VRGMLLSVYNLCCAPNVLCSSTLKTTHVITTTNSQGETTTSAPAVVTQVVTSTAGDGSLTTQTSVIANPTLSPNNGSSGST
jgi:hypothetical protein